PSEWPTSAGSSGKCRPARASPVRPSVTKACTSIPMPVRGRVIAPPSTSVLGEQQLSDRQVSCRGDLHRGDLTGNDPDLAAEALDQPDVVAGSSALTTGQVRGRSMRP